MGKLARLPRATAPSPPERDPRARVGDFREFVGTLPLVEHPRAGGTLHGVRRAVLPPRLSARQPDSRTGTTSSTATAGAKRSSSSTGRTTSPSSPAGSAPRRAKRPACSRSTRANAVSIKQIELAIVNRAWDEGWIVPRPPARGPAALVAVVGSGPAGLACAQQLARAGETVTVFERDESAGGLVRFGVPEFKIEKRLVDRRVEQLVGGGRRVRLRCRRRCGRAAPRSCTSATTPS